MIGAPQEDEAAEAALNMEGPEHPIAEIEEAIVEDADWSPYAPVGPGLG